MIDEVIVVNIGGNNNNQPDPLMQGLNDPAGAGPSGFWEWFLVVMFYLIFGFPIWLLIYLIGGIIYGLTMQALGYL